MATRGIAIAAPASGAGKTVLALALMRALAERGHPVAPAKSGPDYIDPCFHEAAAGAPSVNLDAWAMDPATLHARADRGGLLLVEGAMGAIDGAAPDGRGSTAELAETLGIPLILVLDVRRQAQSAALAVAGLAAMRPGLAIAGVILNRVASARHARMAGGALHALGVPIFGTLAKDPALALPSRHLGLVQAGEHADLAGFVARAALALERGVDLEAIAEAAAPLADPPDIVGEGAFGAEARRLAPIGQRIAVASDVAFAFAYPHLLADWRAAGAEIHPFSPLADEAPDPAADAVYLPGGYPELHAGPLASAQAFREGLAAAARRGATVYGECGGYMVLGDAIIDAKGEAHAMTGLLPLTTSFAARRLTLGYRLLSPRPGGPIEGRHAGHEFHASTILAEGAGVPLFDATDAEGTPLPPMGRRRGRVAGSFAHLIAPLG